jgi:hypothetical protein
MCDEKNKTEQTLSTQQQDESILISSVDVSDWVVQKIVFLF